MISAEHAVRPLPSVQAESNAALNDPAALTGCHGRGRAARPAEAESGCQVAGMVQGTDRATLQQVRDFLMRCKSGRFPSIEVDMKMVMTHCGSLLLDPAALMQVWHAPA